MTLDDKIKRFEEVIAALKYLKERSSGLTQAAEDRGLVTRAVHRLEVIESSNDRVYATFNLSTVYAVVSSHAPVREGLFAGKVDLRADSEGVMVGNSAYPVYGLGETREEALDDADFCGWRIIPCVPRNE